MLLVGFWQSDGSPSPVTDQFRLISLAGTLHALCLSAPPEIEQFIPDYESMATFLPAGTFLPLAKYHQAADEEAVRQFYRQHEATIHWFLEDLRHHHEWQVEIGVLQPEVDVATLQEQIETWWERCVRQAADVCPLPLAPLPPGRMLRRGAFLVPDQAAADFARDAALMQQQATEVGLHFVVVGPLAPGHFVPEL